ncbi:hypothetical protein MMC09_000300 [Bachmanniomyces sp. S44760]|nr:hypothetical protein [Bachmanniomyces sp. S44760]
MPLSLSGVAPLAWAQTDLDGALDHSIQLLDTTAPVSEPPPDSNETSGDESPKSSVDALTRKWTKGTLREELARRKYAKWQESRYAATEAPAAPGDNEEDSITGTTTQETNAKREARRRDRIKDRLSLRHRKAISSKEERPSEVDILYENQRGIFLCGIPLYSSNSLLNLDPGAWQTSAFQDSPVNITDAQVPDPSWTWAWKKWYVDMSQDVDEEGWEYSFAFNPRFAWHGTHPWFHSFVRRRRWLRKRVRTYSTSKRAGESDAKKGHQLSADYFTIHNGQQRDRSRGSSAERAGGALRSSFHSGRAGQDSDVETENEEIDNILALRKALKRSTIDRKKIEYFSNFLDHGGDELFYLPEQMVDLLDLFIYPTSRLQLLARIVDRYEDKEKETTSRPKNGPTDGSDNKAKREVQNLHRAIDAADRYINGSEFWSDVKASHEHHLDNEETASDEKLENDNDALSSPAPPQTEDSDVEIKGIPQEAHVSEEPRMRFEIHDDGEKRDGYDSGKTQNKGKEKEKI